MADTIILRAAKSRASIPLLRLVIGGVAARRRVSVDQLDDMQLAVETLVVEERDYTGDLELQIVVEEKGLVLRLDGLSNRTVKDLLQAPAGEKPRTDRLIDARMLLDSLVDRFDVVEADGGRFGVQIEKWTS